MREEKIVLKNPNAPELKAYVAAIEKTGRSQQVFKHTNGWAVRKFDAQKPTKILQSKDAALKYALKLARNNDAFVFVIGDDGFIKDRLN